MKIHLFISLFSMVVLIIIGGLLGGSTEMLTFVGDGLIFSIFMVVGMWSINTILTYTGFFMRVLIFMLVMPVYIALVWYVLSLM